MNLAELVQGAFSYLKNRVSTEIIYHRVRGETYDPDLGHTLLFWESVAFKSIVIESNSYLTSIPGGKLEIIDAIVVVPKDVFTKQPDETDDPQPRLGDVVEFRGETWKVGTKGGSAFITTDPTNSLWFVGVIRVQD